MGFHWKLLHREWFSCGLPEHLVSDRRCLVWFRTSYWWVCVTRRCVAQYHSGSLVQIISADRRRSSCHRRKWKQMSEFQTVARVGEIPEGEGRSFAVNGTMVGVFLSGGEYRAINDFCPHMGAALADGHVENDAVSCPWHAWRFSLKDGTWLDNSGSSIKTACYEVRVVGEEIQVSVPPAADSSQA